MVQVVVYRPSYELAGAFGREARPKHKSSIAYQKNASLFLPLEKKCTLFLLKPGLLWHVTWGT